VNNQQARHISGAAITKTTEKREKYINILSNYQTQSVELLVDG